MFNPTLIGGNILKSELGDETQDPGISRLNHPVRSVVRSPQFSDKRVYYVLLRDQRPRLIFRD
jgi:hypothetical protein